MFVNIYTNMQLYYGYYFDNTIYEYYIAIVLESRFIFSVAILSNSILTMFWLKLYCNLKSVITVPTRPQLYLLVKDFEGKSLIDNRPLRSVDLRPNPLYNQPLTRAPSHKIIDILSIYKLYSITQMSRRININPNCVFFELRRIYFPQIWLTITLRGARNAFELS